MKKSTLFIALAFGISTAFAQDLTSKKGEPMLPEADDWAISLNADGIFNYVGNAFNGNTGNSAPSVNWLNTDQTIIGKKFIDEKSAYRVLVRLGFTNQTTKAMVTKPVATPAAWPDVPEMVTDKMASKNTNIGIGVGKEMRRGKTRLQGVYGADLMLWVSRTSQKYTYGNSLTPTGAVTVGVSDSHDFGSNMTTTQSGGLAARVTKNKDGLTLGLGVRGFIGAEYFIFPKMSIGAEYGWGIGFQMTGKGKQDMESIGTATGATDPSVGTETKETPGSSKFGFDTDMNNGTIFGFHGSNTGGTASLRATFHF